MLSRRAWVAIVLLAGLLGLLTAPWAVIPR